ncbi:MAG: GNAT family N-acetyltransferase [Candidatus Thorarchaeota archaeon]|nr:GNAT family N-acetyltransferase [Candidatus Thorarchaeota archaeon]
MRIAENAFNEMNLQRLAKTILQARQDDGYWDASMDVARVKEILSETFDDLNCRVIAAEENGNIRGIVLLKSNKDGTAEINPWFLGGLPLIPKGTKDSNKVASALLERAIQYAKSHGLTRVEAFFAQDAHTQYTKSMFKDQGMSLVEEMEHLRSPLHELAISAADFPFGVSVVKLSKIDRERLFNCWHRTFLTGEDRSVLNRSEEERRGFFEEGFDLSREWTDEASLVFASEDTPIAFALVRPTHGRNNAHLWQFGVHPDHRGRGLAKALLKIVCERLNELEFESMSLNVDVGNTSAYELYRSLGFQRKWGLVCYAWKAEG